MEPKRCLRWTEGSLFLGLKPLDLRHAWLAPYWGAVAAQLILDKHSTVSAILTTPGVAVTNKRTNRLIEMGVFEEKCNESKVKKGKDLSRVGDLHRTLQHETLPG